MTRPNGISNEQVFGVFVCVIAYGMGQECIKHKAIVMFHADTKCQAVQFSDCLCARQPNELHTAMCMSKGNYYVKTYNTY